MVVKDGLSALQRLNPCNNKLRVANLFGLVTLVTVLIFEDRNSEIEEASNDGLLPTAYIDTGMHSEPTDPQRKPYPLPSPQSSHALKITTATSGCCMLTSVSTQSHPSSWLENFTLCSGKKTQTQTDLREFRCSTPEIFHSLLWDVVEKDSILICNPRLVPW